MAVLIDARRFQWVRRILARLQPDSLPQAYVDLVRGQLALAEGQPRDAVKHLEGSETQSALDEAHTCADPDSGLARW